MPARPRRSAPASATNFCDLNLDLRLNDLGLRLGFGFGFGFGFDLDLDLGLDLSLDLRLDLRFDLRLGGCERQGDDRREVLLVIGRQLVDALGLYLKLCLYLDRSENLSLSLLLLDHDYGLGFETASGSTSTSTRLGLGFGFHDGWLGDDGLGREVGGLRGFFIAYRLGHRVRQRCAHPRQRVGQGVTAGDPRPLPGSADRRVGEVVVDVDREGSRNRREPAGRGAGGVSRVDRLGGVRRGLLVELVVVEIVVRRDERPGPVLTPRAR